MNVWPYPEGFALEPSNVFWGTLAEQAVENAMYWRGLKKWDRARAALQRAREYRELARQ